MKISIFAKYVRFALLFGLMAPTGQIVAQERFSTRALEYARSAGQRFGERVKSDAMRAYKGSSAGLKRVGARMKTAQKQTIAVAQQEKERVMLGAKAALKHMRGKSLTKNETLLLRGFYKRVAGLLAITAVLAIAGWGAKHISIDYDFDNMEAVSSVLVSGSDETNGPSFSSVEAESEVPTPAESPAPGAASDDEAGTTTAPPGSPTPEKAAPTAETPEEKLERLTQEVRGLRRELEARNARLRAILANQPKQKTD